MKDIEINKIEQAIETIDELQPVGPAFDELSTEEMTESQGSGDVCNKKIRLHVCLI